MVTKTDKTFDCVAYKQRVQGEIYEQIKDLTPEQKLAYFRRSAEEGPFARFFRDRTLHQSETRRGRRGY